MTMVEPKYRGGKRYLVVLAELVGIARRRGTVTYQQIAELIGFPPQGNYMGAEIGHLLGEISEDETNHSRPMLSAVVVAKSGQPGAGFFEFARRLGKLADISRDAERRFWESELAAVYQTWADVRND